MAGITTEGGSKYSDGKTEAGETIWKDYITVNFVTPIKSQFGPVGGHGFCQGSTVVKAVSGADWDAVVAFARTIKKGVTITEKEAAIV